MGFSKTLYYLNFLHSHSTSELGKSLETSGLFLYRCSHINGYPVFLWLLPGPENLLKNIILNSPHDRQPQSTGNFDSLKCFSCVMFMCYKICMQFFSFSLAEFKYSVGRDCVLFILVVQLTDELLN